MAMPAWPLISMTAMFSLITKTTYLLTRLQIIRSSNFSQAHHGYYVFGLELLLMLPAMLTLLLRVATISPPTNRTQSPWCKELPHVDVFITCCGEYVEIIHDTVVAALNLGYPQQKLRVIVLDDGDSLKLRRQVERLQVRHNNLHYTARIKSSIPDYKAGNLNHGLMYTALLPGGPAPLIAGLDADAIVCPQWLRDLVTRISQDPELGMVASPQHFCNLPRNDILGQAFSTYFSQHQMIHDYLGAPDNTGTGYVLRRAAIEAIGGWQTDTASEDTCASLMLLGAGWRIKWMPGAQQICRAPESLLGFIMQKTRWSDGNLRNAWKTRFRLYGRASARCTLVQRLCGLVGSVQVVLMVLWPVTFVGLALQLFSGLPLVTHNTWEQLRYQMMLASIASLTEWLHCLSMALYVGSPIAFAFGELDYWLTPYYFVGALKSFVLPSYLGGNTSVFTSSGSVQTSLNERNPTKRAPLRRRVYVMLFEYGLWIHVCFATLCACSVYKVCSMAVYSASFGTGMQRVLVVLLWPPLHWIKHCWSYIIPLWYMISPPDNPPELWHVDEKTGVRYPLRKGPERTILGNPSDFVNHAVTLHALGCLIISVYL